MTQNQGNDGSLKDLWLGIAITIAIYAIGGFILMLIIGIFGIFLAFIAHVAVIAVSFQKGKTRLGQGLLIGLGVVVLLVAACFGILLYNFG